MHDKHWHTALMGLLVLGTMALPVLAQDAELAASRMETKGGSSPLRSAGLARRGGFAAKLEKTLGLTPEQRDAVRGLLAQQHQQMTALRQETAPKYQSVRSETDAKIRGLLNPEQQKKFDALITQQKASAAKFQRGGKRAE